MSSETAAPPVWDAPWPPGPGQGKAREPVGRAYIELPTMGDPRARATVREGGLDLVRVGATGHGDQEIWELPVIWRGVSRATVPQIEIEVETHSRRFRHTIRVPRPPSREPEESTASTDQADLRTARSAADEDVPSTIDRLWQHHAEMIREWCDGRLDQENGGVLARRVGQLCIAPLAIFCSKYWRDACTEDAEHALIVDIASRCRELVERLALSPRRVLRRKRRLMPIARAQQVDAACLRWLVRQPGRSITEKAGPRQQVLAVVREPGIDTPENRVLRRFLELCARDARLYVRNYREFTSSQKVMTVRRFGGLVRRLLVESELRAVPPMVGIPEPNYVLQFDPDYSQIWYWYRRLVHQDRERENLRAWHHRTWAERCRTAVFAFLEKDSLDARSFRGSAHLRREPFHGSYLSRSTSAGPWAYSRTAGGSLLRAVERDELGLLPGLERLQRTAYDWVLLLQDAFDNRRIHAALGIYSMHLLDENDTDVRERLADLEAWIQPDGTSATTPLAALVLVPSRNGAEPYVQSPGQHVTACRIPGPRDSVVDRGWTALGKCLDAFARWRRE